MGFLVAQIRVAARCVRFMFFLSAPISAPTCLLVVFMDLLGANQRFFAIGMSMFFLIADIAIFGMVVIGPAAAGAIAGVTMRRMIPKIMLILIGAPGHGAGGIQQNDQLQLLPGAQHLPLDHCLHCHFPLIRANTHGGFRKGNVAGTAVCQQLTIAVV